MSSIQGETARELARLSEEFGKRETGIRRQFKQNEMGLSHDMRASMDREGKQRANLMGIWDRKGTCTGTSEGFSVGV